MKAPVKAAEMETERMKGCLVTVSCQPTIPAVHRAPTDSTSLSVCGWI